jgi:hypothetical protein
MKSGHTLQSSLIITLTRLTRLSFVVIVIILISVSVTALANRFFDQQQRVFVIMIGAISIVIFALSHAIFEARSTASSLNRRFRYLSAGVVFLLLLPVAFIVLRHTILPADWIQTGNYIMIAIVMALLVLPLPALDGAQSYGSIFAVSRHMNRIMWNPFKDSEYSRDIVDSAEVSRIRARLYVDKKHLQVFQQTLSTPELDAESAAQAFPSPMAAGLTLLDIGGGDGLFTSNLARRVLAPNTRFQKVTLLDPVGWKDHYVGAMDKYVAAGGVTHVEDRVENSSYTGTHDVVLAVHSLYSACDAASGDKRQHIEAIVKRVIDWTKPNGYCVIALASRTGRAYGFKDEALRFLFGQTVRDLTAEDMSMVSLLRSSKLTRVDNVIDLTSEFEEWDNGNRERMESWLSYFLRYPVSGDQEVATRLVGLLRSYVQPLDSLPEQVLPRLRALASSPSDSSRVLAHKTHVWVVNT